MKKMNTKQGNNQIYNAALHTGRPVVESVVKITEIVEVDRHVSSRSIAQELQIMHKIVLNHLHKVGFKKKLDVWVQHQLTPKHLMDRISIYKALAKWNEIDPFLKRLMTGDEKWITSLLSTTGQLEASDRPETAIIDQQKKCCVPSGKRQTKHVCSDSPGTLGSRLESFNASTI
ncbi:histone-lysine N-methyltransferase SETMAR [Trichonephila clavipes]|nr:histone-lysine N-methyltransferase SETMAR [Trichonephila clavipes]